VKPLPVRGRGAVGNPANRFDGIDVDREAWTAEDPGPETRLLRDRSRSIITRNRSPDVGFEASINPYRGCEHGCVYCMDGDTPILLGDGRTRKLRELEVGDIVYGTVRRGWYRRLVRTPVLAHWSTVKPAYTITLADGTRLVASADHRFLTERGWKHVTGEEQGRFRRPHLTLHDRLMGWGGFAPSIRPGPSYRRGYLCGTIRGDGLLASNRYEREGRRHGDPWQFRLELKDAEGSNSGGALRIVSSDTSILECPEGSALKSAADLRVVSIDPLPGERELFDITTGTGDFIADGVVSHNCYARPTHEYLGFSSGLDFESRILVKEDAPRLLREALSSPDWEPQVLAMSGVTDPYQPAERRLRITRGCVEVLAEARNPVSIITKSRLVTRDADLLADLASHDAARVTVSLTSLDESLRRVLEPRAPTPERRLEAMRKLADAGVPVGVLVAPVIPGLTEHELPAILEAAAGAGATHAGWVMLRLPHGVSGLFEEWLETHFPWRKDKVLGRIRDVRGGELDDRRFGSRMRGAGPLADHIAGLFRVAARRFGLDGGSTPLSTTAFRRPSPPSPTGSPAPQLSLF
jgi:DNA repair photolyase